MLTTESLHLFTGTSQYYRHWLNRFVLTDGVHYICNYGGAWIVDAIASHQTKELLSDPMLQEFQFWKLRVNMDRSAVLTCLRDTDDVMLTQEIEYTDFALDEVRLYLVEGILMLPSEY